MSPSRFACLLLLTLLVGCASGPGIPDSTYYRLPPASVSAPEGLRFEHPVVVETLLADGLHSDLAILYALDPEGLRLRAYHYHLWVDPPVRLLQRRLMATLRRASVAPLVVDRLPPQAEAIRVTGRIARLERIPEGEGWKVAVSLGLRADGPGRDGPPLLVRRYDEMLPVDGNRVADSVRVMGQALDRITERFLADLAKARS